MVICLKSSQIWNDIKIIQFTAIINILYICASFLFNFIYYCRMETTGKDNFQSLLVIKCALRLPEMWNLREAPRSTEMRPGLREILSGHPKIPPDLEILADHRKTRVFPRERRPGLLEVPSLQGRDSCALQRTDDSKKSWNGEIVCYFRKMSCFSCCVVLVFNVRIYNCGMDNCMKAAPRQCWL